ncbi:MAG: tetratricopeptide repeat protein, partial [Verrucomicrobia bacterium]|nr:tetratricopeptide repeat protein [Verrucomicrobiota bacterium]
MKLTACVVPVLLLGTLSTLRGQEVRRALPVAPTPTPNDYVPRAQPVQPLNPFNSRSILREGITPAPTPSPKPQASAKSSGSDAEPDAKFRDQVTNKDEIRLAPGANTTNKDPAAAQLAIADGLYARKLYDLAAGEYEKFVGQYRDNPERPAALYRLADCYTRLGQDLAAVNAYRSLLLEGGGGEYVGNAAFRLASRAFDQHSYADAATMYEKAADNAKSPEVKLTARYYQAKCLEFLNRKPDAKTVYQSVAAVKDNNPYRDAARLSLAYFSLESNKKKEAADLFEDLAQDAAKPVIKAEALTRAGILNADLKNKDKAEQLFKTVIANGPEGKWKQIAQLELMKSEYDGDHFTQVLDAYAKNPAALSEDTKPTVLLMVANSYRELGKFDKAVDVYNQLIHQYPSSADSLDARYQRLIALDALKDPSLIKEVDTYLGFDPPRDRADKAKLLKAQALVQVGQFAAAGKLYFELVNSSLADSYKADCYYAAGFCLSQIHDTQHAIDAFTGLIDNYPNHKMMTTALLKRATLYQDERNYSAADADFSKIINDYPKAPERETALLQKGLTLGQVGDYAAMSDAFADLIKEYPNGAGAPQANFWIGWAAFEQKRYQDAVKPLLRARELNPTEYREKVTLRLIYCYQTLQQEANASKEVDDFVQAEPNQLLLVSDACKWLGQNYSNEHVYDRSAKYLDLYAKAAGADKVEADVWFTLAQAKNSTQQYADAETAAQAYLKSATDPADKARGLLALATAQVGLKKYPEAVQSAEEAMNLQPEGRLNAEARLEIGDIAASQGNFEAAARSYLSVAVLYEDPEITPRALAKAYTA